MNLPAQQPVDGHVVGLGHGIENGHLDARSGANRPIGVRRRPTMSRLRASGAIPPSPKPATPLCKLDL
jgi:hypothetical protein